MTRVAKHIYFCKFLLVKSKMFQRTNDNFDPPPTKNLSGKYKKFQKCFKNVTFFDPPPHQKLRLNSAKSAKFGGPPWGVSGLVGGGVEGVPQIDEFRLSFWWGGGSNQYTKTLFLHVYTIKYRKSPVSSGKTGVKRVPGCEKVWFQKIQQKFSFYW